VVDFSGSSPVKALTLFRATRAATRRAKNRDMMNKRIGGMNYIVRITKEDVGKLLVCVV
jgi:hypothetical protein